jgi:hypothetical protein
MNAGTPPRAGWRKCDLVSVPNASAPLYLRTLPDASAAAYLNTQVPFDIVETYDRELLISVEITQIDRLIALAQPLTLRVIQLDDYDHLWLWPNNIDTRLPISVPKNGLPDANYVSGQWGTYLIQFHGPEKTDWLHAGQDLGAVMVYNEFVNGYTIGATPEIAEAVRQLPFVQWSSPLHPYLKHAPSEYHYANGVVLAYARIVNADGATDVVKRIFGDDSTLIRNERIIGAHGYLTQDQVKNALREPLVVAVYAAEELGGGSGGGGSGGGATPQIPTLSELALAFLGIILAAIAIRR